jgi:UDP-2,3-diacylglucosamine pyrophosphatase LpxH
MSTMQVRSVFISDVHLGLPDCQATFLLDFLTTCRCENLYLVGDIVDLENMRKRPYWHTSHDAVIAEIFAIAARGTKIIYIPGNHDAELRRFAGQRISGISVALNAIHIAADGRRYKVSHGDEFDTKTTTPAWLVKFGDFMQGVVCAMNRYGNVLLRAVGIGYRPISIAIKSRIATALRFIRDFETRVAASAKTAGFDGHICGHIHYGRIEDRNGVTYLNDGGWVEHCTALVEHANGSFELLHWTERRETLAVSTSSLPAEPWPVAA